MHILMRVVLLIRMYVARSARWWRTVKTDAHARARALAQKFRKIGFYRGRRRRLHETG